MFCSNCGKEVVGSGKFCVVCGTPVVEFKDDKDFSNDTVSPNDSIINETIKEETPINDVIDTKINVGKGIILKSAEDIEGSVNLDIFFSTIGIVFLMIVISKASGVAAVGLLTISFWLVYIAVLLFKALFYNQALDKKQFSFVNGMNCETIIQEVSDKLISEHGYSLALENEQIIIKKDSTTYTVIVNDNGTFSIVWNNLLKNFKMRAPFVFTNQHNLIKNYGIIAYAIQEKFNVTE
ncbi:MAG: zinc ribbon domain-containing protein [Ruminococcus sp.]|nr:zinc ribbon domain-containing protein [Ruminococcus sp.]